MVIYLKTNLDSVLILQKWCLCIITFSFHIAHNNLLFSDLKILRFHILISAGTKSFFKFFRDHLCKYVSSQLNLVNEGDTQDICKKSIMYIPKISTNQYDRNSLHGDGASLWNEFFKDFFHNHDFTSLFKSHTFLNNPFQFSLLDILRNAVQQLIRLSK